MRKIAWQISARQLFGQLQQFSRLQRRLIAKVDCFSRWPGCAEHRPQVRRGNEHIAQHPFGFAAHVISNVPSTIETLTPCRKLFQNCVDKRSST